MKQTLEEAAKQGAQEYNIVGQTIYKSGFEAVTDWQTKQIPQASVESLQNNDAELYVASDTTMNSSAKIDYFNRESISIMEYTSKTLLAHELGAMLYALGDDILKQKIELKLDSTISEFYFRDHKELQDLCTKIYTYKVDSWKIIRLCINLSNLLLGKNYLLYPDN